jgi:hypothetical protein
VEFNVSNVFIMNAPNVLKKVTYINNALIKIFNLEKVKDMLTRLGKYMVIHAIHVLIGLENLFIVRAAIYTLVPNVDVLQLKNDLFLMYFYNINFDLLQFIVCYKL